MCVSQGNLGGGLASIMADYMKFDNIEETQLTVLTGMSAAFGALFPTPLLGVLMIHELGNPPR
jgi:H+/Cl- antiporter ClcA